MTQSVSLDENATAFILESLNQAVPMIRNLAYHCHAEFEELYQTAAEQLVIAYPYAMRMKNPRGYLQSSVQQACLLFLGEYPGQKHRIEDRCQMLSIDAPAPFNTNYHSLAEILADTPTSHGDESLSEAIHAALSRLTVKQRETLYRLYGFEGYGYQSTSEYAHVVGVPVSAIASRRHYALVALRKDAKLCAAIGVEVQG